MFTLTFRCWCSTNGNTKLFYNVSAYHVKCYWLSDISLHTMLQHSNMPMRAIKWLRQFWISLHASRATEAWCTTDETRTSDATAQHECNASKYLGNMIFLFHGAKSKPHFQGGCNPSSKHFEIVYFNHISKIISNQSNLTQNDEVSKLRISLLAMPLSRTLDSVAMVDVLYQQRYFQIVLQLKYELLLPCVQCPFSMLGCKECEDPCVSMAPNMQAEKIGTDECGCDIFDGPCSMLNCS